MQLLFLILQTSLHVFQLGPMGLLGTFSCYVSPQACKEWL